jgi:hypothetical protein
MVKNLTPEKALIFRITHRDNVSWILENGLHCRNSTAADPKFVQIGNPDLIAKRTLRSVPCPPGGPLSDYVPFYFTPFSPMLYNVQTGWNGIAKRSASEIAILVSSLRTLGQGGIPFVFTDRHAYLAHATFSSDLNDLGNVDWALLQSRDFRRSDADPGKVERYQAEALVHRHLPTSALAGIVFNAESSASDARELASERGLSINVVAKPGWFF